MSTLVGTQLRDAHDDLQTPAQRAAAKERQWTFLTQWSLPKMETLRIVIPGLYGYRLDTPRPYDGNKLRSLDGGNYWGSMGQDPVLDRVAEVEEVIAAFGQRNVVPGELAKALNVSVQKATQLMTLVQNKNQLA